MTKKNEGWQPIGIEFYDAASERQMLLVTDGSYEGWLCFRVPNGEWVTQRLATEDDKRKITQAFQSAHIGGATP